jgi:hypothetical protein
MRFISILFFTLLGRGELPAQFISNNAIEASILRAFAKSHETNHSQMSELYDHSPALQSPMQYATRGDVASGRVIREENDELDLDTSPCDANRVVRFHKPYDKTVIRQAKCGEKAFDRTQVEQK